MGVKHAVNVTRAQAEAKYIELHMRSQWLKRREKLEDRLHGLDLHDIGIPYDIQQRMSDLTVDDVREIVIGVDIAGRESSMRKKAMIALADLQGDAVLEMELTSINDRVAGGEGFESYYVTADGLNEL